MSTLEQVMDIIASKGQVDRARLSDASVLTELGISSLDIVEIIFSLEDTFGIQIPFNANATELPYKTVGELAKAVEDLRGKK